MAARCAAPTSSAPPVPGRVLAICGDTLPCDAAVELARGADLLVARGHLRRGAPADGGRARPLDGGAGRGGGARAPAARALVITHFSARYQQSSGETVDDLLAEARAVFPATDAAHDLMTVAVPRRAPVAA